MRHIMFQAGISGIGLLTAAGRNTAETAAALWQEQPALPALPRRISTALKLPVFETVLDKPADFSGGYPLFFLLHALDEALAQAKLDTPELRADLKIGIAVGTTVACQLDNIPFHAAVRAGNCTDYRAALNYVQGIPAEYVQKKLRLTGPAVTISNACASGADAAMVALDWLKTGVCDVAIACGTDALSKVSFNGFNALRVCGNEPCRPFDRDRKGLNLGDGAAVVILEAPEQAARRGATVETVLSGAGKSADAFHITQPESSAFQLERAISEALAEAQISSTEISYINAHGTGTGANDLVEANLFQRLFPGTAYSSTKTLTGHTLGAAGTVELAFAALMLKHGKAVANHRFHAPDEGITALPATAVVPLDESAAILSTSLAFGGSNTALVVRHQSRSCALARKNLLPVGVEKFFVAAPGEPDGAATLALCRKYGLRRLDRITTLALCAADRLMENAEPEGTALITVTSYGPVKTTSLVVNDILDYPEDEILPTGFSHSVVNAAASYIGVTQKIHGATFALTGFDDPFFEAVTLAQTLISAGRCRKVLLIAADESCELSQAVETLRRSDAPQRDAGVAGLLLSGTAERKLELLHHPAADQRLLPCGVPAKFCAALTHDSGSVTLQRLTSPLFALNGTL